MKITESQLRHLINEEIKLAMKNNLIQEKDKDQDDDGDNDFDDVRIARYIKGGKSKEDALKIVKKKSMGKNEST